MPAHGVALTERGQLQTETPKLSWSGQSRAVETSRLQRQPGLEMELSGFQIRPISGPVLADFEGLDGPKPLQNPSKLIGTLRAPPFWMGFGAV